MTQLLWYYAKVLAKTKNDNTNLETQLSNDPGKKGSNFFCCDAIRFPYIKMFSFLRRECINLQKDCLRKKMYLNSTFKGCIFVLKHFDQLTRVANNGQEMFTILHDPHIRFLCYLDSDEILL